MNMELEKEELLQLFDEAVSKFEKKGDYEPDYSKVKEPEKVKSFMMSVSKMEDGQVIEAMKTLREKCKTNSELRPVYEMMGAFAKQKGIL